MIFKGTGKTTWGVVPSLTTVGDVELDDARTRLAR
jgi:hypothetical protein